MSALEQLADLVGVAAGYTDAFGKPVETPLEVRRGLLAALGFAVEDEAAIAGSLAEVERLRRGLIPPLLPVEARRAARVPVRPQNGAPHTLVWRLVDERGTAREGRANPQGSEPSFELPPLTPGYHRLIVQAGPTRTESWVIAAPQRCWRPRPYTEEGPPTGVWPPSSTACARRPISASAPTRMPARPPARPPCAGRPSWA